MRVVKTGDKYKACIKLNSCDVSGFGSTKEKAIENLIKVMTKKINALEKEVNSMYNFERYVKSVISGNAGC